MKRLQAFDVDTEALADTFERMAEGLRTGDVGLQAIETGHRARVEDVSEFELAIEFVATHEYDDVVDGIEYETDTEDQSDNE
jgi:hypothetical protein